MKKSETVKLETIVLDNSIYPRSSIDHKRVSMFEENMRDGFEFDPIQLQQHPEEPENRNMLGIPQERVGLRLGLDQKTIHSHLGGKPELAFLLNAELKKGFSVNQTAEKHGWPESLVWSLKLDGKDDLGKCNEL